MAVWMWSTRLAPPWGEVQARPAPGCDVQRQACEAVFADGARLVLRLHAADSPTAERDIEVLAQGFTPRDMNVDLDGETMNMGPNHTRLSQDTDGLWRGRTVLSACVSGRMAWVLTLWAPAGGGQRFVRYRFETGG